MRLLLSILRVYSYIFEAVLCVMGLLLSIFSAASSHVDVRLGWLPWSGPEQVRWVAGLSILGLILVALAAVGTLRILLFLFSGAVVYILAKGLFLNTQYTFTGMPDVHNALFLLGGAILAFIGALPIKSSRRY